MQQVKNIRIIGIIMLALAAGLPQARGGALYLVATNGAHVTPFDTWDRAAGNIQSALDLAQDGDIIMVDEGIYTPSTTINLDKGVVLMSRQGAAATIISGSDAIRCVNVRHPDAVLDGFTLTAGSAARGGGLWITNGLARNCIITGNQSQLFGGGADIQLAGVVRDCLISENSVPTDGGALGGGACLSDGGTLLNSTLSGNEAFGGGGLAMFDGTLAAECTIVSNRAWDTIGWGVGSGGGAQLMGTNITLRDSVIAHNVAQELGGGAYLSGHAGQKLRGCLIYDNEAVTKYGGGVYINLGTSYAIENCTIVGNRAPQAFVGVGGGVCAGANDQPLLRNSIVYFNTAAFAGDNYYVSGVGAISGSNNCTTPAMPGSANIILPPLLTDHYRLSSNSPCINTGANQDWMASAQDLDGKPRIIDNTVDMGAFEYGQGAGYTSLVLRVISPTDNQVFGIPAEIEIAARAEQEWGGGGITQTVITVNGTVMDLQAWDYERYCMIDTVWSDPDPSYYLLTLTAHDAHGRSASTSIFFTVKDLLPGIPQDLEATVDSQVNRVLLDWQGATECTLYEIWRSPAQAPADASLLASVSHPVTYYTDDTAPAGQSQLYWVRGVNEFGYGAFSDPAQGRALLGPAIRVNGESRLELPAGTRDINVTVTLGVGGNAGTPCDWWLAAYSLPDGQLYYMDAGFAFQPAAGPADLRPVSQDGLYDIAQPMEVISLLPEAPAAGTELHFYFGLDTLVNGRLDMDPGVFFVDEAVVQFK